jgi:plasmid rolling circle replication initiator protein Rep
LVVIRGAQNYISQDEWTEFWKKSAKLDYRPIVDVRSIKPKNEKIFIFYEY